MMGAKLAVIVRRLIFHAVLLRVSAIKVTGLYAPPLHQMQAEHSTTMVRELIATHRASR